MNIDEINFQDQIFKTREIYLPEFGVVTISTTSLSGLLLDEDEEYTSQEAIYVDEQIFFFVEDDEITLPEKKLRSLIMSSVC